MLQFARLLGQKLAKACRLSQAQKVFDWIQIGRATGQQCHLYGAIRAVKVLAHDAALVLRCAVPYDHQLASELRAPRFEEFDDLRAFDRAVV
ncbi:hypothetical protein WJ82_24000 [Burkholderia ubonensis]|nr:hypothetical protein WJ82_24000 [Burkholderia ubonensis]OJB43983.1 hypothetical protein BGV59_25955 [Burkholderia ubonensis]